MSHSSINDKLRQLAKDIQAGVDNSELVKAIAMQNEQRSISNIKNIDLRSCHDFSGRLIPDPYSIDRARLFQSRCIFVETKETGIDTAKAVGDYSATKHTGWLVLQGMQRHDGSRFIAPTFCETKPEAELYASNFDNVVAIMPIEWEE